MIYSPRAAPSVNKSHIPSLPKNNPYLVREKKPSNLIEGSDSKETVTLGR